MRKSRLAHCKQDLLIKSFVAGMTARKAAYVCKVNRKTAAFFYLRLRQVISEASENNKRQHSKKISVTSNSFGHAKQRTEKEVCIDRSIAQMLGRCKPVLKTPCRELTEDLLLFVEIKDICNSHNAKNCSESVGQEYPPQFTNQISDNVDCCFGSGHISVDPRDEWCGIQWEMRRYNGIRRVNMNLFIKEYEWRHSFEDRVVQLSALARLVDGNLR